MSGEEPVLRFRNEFEKIFRALKTSYESEKRLVKRCTELEETNTNIVKRVDDATRLKQVDTNKQYTLKESLADVALRYEHVENQTLRRCSRVVSLAQGVFRRVSSCCACKTSDVAHFKCFWVHDTKVMLWMRSARTMTRQRLKVQFHTPC